MCNYFVLVLMILGCNAELQERVLPVEICSLEDNQCLKAQFQEAVPVFMSGIPELGIEVMDPMNLADFKFNVSGLQFALKDGKLEGLKTITIDSVKWDLRKNKFEVTCHLDSIITGHYTAGGRVIMLAIYGDGEMILKLKNVYISLTVDYEIEKRDDKEFIVPKNVHFDFKVKDNAHFNLTNLFNGKKDPSDTMLQFLNNDWKTVSQEFGRPILEEAAKILFENVKTYFKQNAISDTATKPLDKNGMSRVMPFCFYHTIVIYVLYSYITNYQFLL